jgi:hypothetical protein
VWYSSVLIHSYQQGFSFLIYAHLGLGSLKGKKLGWGDMMKKV